MAELEKAKLVRATAGRSGGFELERGAEGITLQDIYQAVEDATVFRMHKTDPNSKCPVACQMGKILGALCGLLKAPCQRRWRGQRSRTWPKRSTEPFANLKISS